MTTLAIKDLDRRTSRLSRPLRDNEEVTLTYHDKPLGQAVPFEQWMALQDELHSLRAIVAAGQVVPFEQLQALLAELNRLRAIIAEHGLKVA